jgi:hypothetical protein
MPPPPTPSPPTAAGSLSAIPRQLRADPVLGVLLGAADATVAVPESAQAIAAAALATFTERTPLVVVTPTGLDAERLADDLTCLLANEDGPAPGDDVGALSGAVTILPAWETLPFERVSPEIETMGRRLAVIHALNERDAAWPAPRVIVSPVRALLQRLAPIEAASWRAGTGASTRSSTEVSSRCAAASSTSSRQRPTCPCASTCGVTRWTASPPSRSATSVPRTTSRR